VRRTAASSFACTTTRRSIVLAGCAVQPKEEEVADAAWRTNRALRNCAVVSGVQCAGPSVIECAAFVCWCAARRAPTSRCCEAHWFACAGGRKERGKRARRMRTCVACYRRVGQPGGDGAVWSAPTTGPTTAACGPGSGILIRRRALGRTHPGHVSARVASMSPTPGSTPASTGRLVGARAPSPAGWNDAVDHFA
jgi:hypothetical protein